MSPQRAQSRGSWSVLRGLLLTGVCLSLLFGTGVLIAGAAKATPTITVSGAGTFDFNNLPHAATGAVTGAVGEDLGAATISYVDLSTNVESAAPPVKPGTYRVNAYYGGNADYFAEQNLQYTINITLNAAIGDVAVDINNATIKKLNAADGTVKWSAALVNDGAVAVDPLDYSVYTGLGGHAGATRGGPGIGYKLIPSTPGSAANVWPLNTPVSRTAVCNFFYLNHVAVDALSADPGVVWTQEGCFGGVAKSDRTSGAQQWSAFTNDIHLASVDPASGQIYASTRNGYSTLYSATTTGAVSSAASCESITDLNPADGQLYRAGGGCGLVLQQIARSPLGTVNWTVNLAGYVMSIDAMAVQPFAGGLVYVASAASSVVAVVDPVSHIIVRTINTPVPPNFLAVNPKGGGFYIASNSDPHVYAYGQNGWAWTSPDLGGPITALAAARGVYGTSPVSDTIAPFVIATRTPLPTGSGWSNTDVTVTLDATDESGGSGVQSITYALDGGTPVTSGTSSLSFSFTAEGTKQLTFYATDVAGNSSQPQTLFVQIDKTKPTVLVPGDIYVPGAPNFVYVPFTPAATDTGSGISTTQLSPDTHTFPVGRTQLTFSAQDAADNYASATFNVIVGPWAGNDFYSMNQGTTLTIPAPGVLQNDWIGPNSAPNVEFYPPPGVTVQDAGGSGGFALTPPPNFVGTINFTYLIHSNDGDSNAANIEVLVNDAAPPVITVPADITLFATSNNGATVNYPASAFDAVDGPLTVDCAPQSGSVFPIGTTTVSCSASDSHFNYGSANFTVTVNLRALTSISVDPQISSVPVGGTQFYTATGHYNDGSSQQLLNGQMGGGPPRYSGHLTPGIDLSACTTPQYPAGSVAGGLSIVGFAVDPATATIIPQQWSQATPIVEVSGTLQNPQVPGALAHVVFSCSLSGFAGTASFDGTWNPILSKYEGTFTGFNGDTGTGTITGWSKKQQMPRGRFALGAATLSVGGFDMVYVASGATNSSPIQQVDAYHAYFDFWTPAVTNLPHPREGAAMAALNGLIYVAGGHEGPNATTRVEAYNPATNSWAMVAPMNNPRAEFQLVAAGGSLYALGGQQGSGPQPPIAWVERYDPAQDQWHNVAGMPAAKAYFAAGLLDVLGRTTIVVTGGSNSSTSLYDVATDTWSGGAPIPTGPGTSAGGVVNNTLWVITSSGYPVGSSTLGYFPATSGPNAHPDGWAGLDSMPAPRSEIAVAVANGDVLFTFGGNDGTPNTAYDTVEALTTPPVGDLAIGQGGGPATLSWSSSNPGVATADANGNALAVGPGTATIIASAAGVSCLSTDTCGSLTVTNSAPTVSVFSGGPNTINVGQTFGTPAGSGSDGSFFDNPTDAPWTAQVSYGDGGAPQPLALAPGGGLGPTGTFNFSHVYQAAGTFTVTVYVTDKFGATGSATRTVTVNAPAVVSLGGPYAIDEGGTLNGSGSFTDNAPPGGGNWTVKVTYGDNTGQQFLPSMSGPGSFTFSHYYKDSGSYTISVVVGDPNGLDSPPIITTVAVANVAPTIALQSSVSIQEGATNWNVSGSFSDPGASDFLGSNSFPNTVANAYYASVDYGDGTVQPLNINGLNNNAGNGPVSGNFNLQNHAYADNGTYTLTVTVRDRDGASTSRTMTVNVSNVAPTMGGLGGGAGLPEGGTFTRGSLTFNDPGSHDGWVVTVNYGDGTGNQTVQYTANPNNFPRATFNLSHLYVDNGSFTVSVFVTDKDGGTSATATTGVTVSNQPPDLAFLAMPTQQAGSPFSLTGVFFDQGANDAPWTGTITWGDNTGIQPLAFTPGGTIPGAPNGIRGTFTTPAHSYAVHGSYSLFLTIRDKDGGFRSRSFPISVDSDLVSIQVTPNPAYLNTIGATLQFIATATLADGTHETTSIAPPINPGDPVWSSTHPGVATVDPFGMVTAVGQGVTTIIVSDPSGQVSCVNYNGCATLTVDTTAPAIAAPAAVTAEATSSAGAAVTFSFSATDNIDQHPSVSADHPSGGTFPIGTTDVLVTAADANGNISTFTIRVTVADTTAPAIDPHADVTAETTNPGGTTISYLPPATLDAVDGGGTASCSPASGSNFPVGSSTVTCNAVDAAGNHAPPTTFNVTVRLQGGPPTIDSVTASTPQLWPPDHTYHAETISVIAHAAGGASMGGTCRIVSATSNEPDNGLGDGDTANDIVVTGPLTLNLRAERSGAGVGRTYTIGVRCTDPATGLSSVSATAVTVPHNR